MKRLRFEYSARLEFAENITEHCFTLRCLPISDGRQLIREAEYEIFPETFSRIRTSRDSFGNTLLCGRISEPHSFFTFRVSGKAEIINTRDISGYPSAVYRYTSPLTVQGERIRSFYMENTPTANSQIDRAVELCNALYSAMKYEKGVTDVHTSAEDALKLGAGVCQDYAHIFLALCRLDGICCRYVSGLAYESGETHAWTEIASGSKWYGVDPANNRFIGENYIKLCHGRDYSDCPIERGIYLGNSAGIQTVTSTVTEF